MFIQQITAGDCSRKMTKAEAEKQIKSFHGNQYTLASESGLVQNDSDHAFMTILVTSKIC